MSFYSQLVGFLNLGMCKMHAVGDRAQDALRFDAAENECCTRSLPYTSKMHPEYKSVNQVQCGHGDLGCNGHEHDTTRLGSYLKSAEGHINSYFLQSEKGCVETLGKVVGTCGNARNAGLKHGTCVLSCALI